MHALQVLLFVWPIPLAIDNEKPKDYDHGRQRAKEKISIEEAPDLLPEEIFVEAKLIIIWHDGQAVPINHEIFIFEENVVDVVGQQQHDQHHKVCWVNAIIASMVKQNRDKQSECDQMHTKSEVPIEFAQSIMLATLLFFSRNHGVNHDAEGQEESILTQEH